MLFSAATLPDASAMAMENSPPKPAAEARNASVSARSGRIDGLGSVDVGDHVGRLDRTAGSGDRRMFDMAQCEDARCDIAHVGHCIADAQCDGGHDGNRHRDRSASSRIAVIASVIHSQTTPSLRHLFTIRTIWIATKHLMTVHTAAGKPQPLCSIGFHSDLANTAWNEIGT